MSLYDLEDVIRSLATEILPEHAEARGIYIVQDNGGVRVDYSDCEILEKKISSYRVMYQGWTIYSDGIEVMDKLVKTGCITKLSPIKWRGKNTSVIFWK